MHTWDDEALTCFVPVATGRKVVCRPSLTYNAFNGLAADSSAHANGLISARQDGPSDVGDGVQCCASGVLILS